MIEPEQLALARPSFLRTHLEDVADALVCEDRRIATRVGDGRRVVRQRGGTDDGTYDILLSPRLVEFAFGRALTGEAATIDLVTDDDGSVLAVTARTDTQALTVAATALAAGSPRAAAWWRPTRRQTGRRSPSSTPSDRFCGQT